MPEIKLVRIWCKECGDYKLHNRINDEYICKSCDTVHVNTPLSAIPKEKIMEQRMRYRAMKSNEFFQAMAMVNSTSNFHKNIPQSIYETDAGIIAIVERKKKEREAEIEFRRDEKLRFANVKPNAPCVCNSGKKYKKCCMVRIISYG